MNYFRLKDGNRLAYEDTGSGDHTIVLLHGWTSSGRIYKKPAELLKEQARCIYYDQRGHSGSKNAAGENVTMETLASDLQELLTGLSLTDVTLAGWSMGACVCLNYLRMFGGGRLKNVVLCDMSPKLLNDEEWKLGLKRGSYTKADHDKECGVPFQERYKSFVLAAVPDLKKYPKPVAGIVARYKLRRNNVAVMESLAASMKLQDNRDVVGHMEVPLFYFYADPGSLFLPGLEEWYRQHAAGEYHSVRFPDSTHQFITEHPEAFAGALRDVVLRS